MGSQIGDVVHLRAGVSVNPREDRYIQVRHRHGQRPLATTPPVRPFSFSRL